MVHIAVGSRETPFGDGEINEVISGCGERLAPTGCVDTADCGMDANGCRGGTAGGGMRAIGCRVRTAGGGVASQSDD